jgi:hypothetical protein
MDPKLVYDVGVHRGDDTAYSPMCPGVRRSIKRMEKSTFGRLRGGDWRPTFGS